MDQAQKIVDFLKEYQQKVYGQIGTRKPLKFNCSITVLKDVNEITEGKSFGELALLTEKPRNATIYAKTARVALGVLTKRDYERLIGEDFKSKMDKAVGVLRQFQIFRNIKQQRDLFSLSYYLKERVLLRGAMLYH